MVLLFALLVIFALAGLAMDFSKDSALALKLAARAKERQQAYEMARSGVDFALAMLHQDKNQAWDSLREPWARFGRDPFPDVLPAGVLFSGAIADENGKININALVNGDGTIDGQREAQARRLFRILDLGEEVLDSLLDWLDRDDAVRIGGAESDYYQGLPSPHPCPNGPLVTMGQIFQVKDMRGENRRVLDYLTIYSDGKVNINTAPKEVLECLSDKIGPSLAEAIVRFRNDVDFTGKEALKKVPGVEDALYRLLEPWITVRSSAVSIESHGECGKAKGKIRAVVQRHGKRANIVYFQVQ